MKIIFKDNTHGYRDYVICQRVYEWYGEIIVKYLNDTFSEEHGGVYILVKNNYPAEENR
jgi:hypothetical protein